MTHKTFFGKFQISSWQEIHLEIANSKWLKIANANTVQVSNHHWDFKKKHLDLQHKGVILTVGEEKNEEKFMKQRVIIYVEGNSRSVTFIHAMGTTERRIVSIADQTSLTRGEIRIFRRRSVHFYHVSINFTFCPCVFELNSLHVLMRRRIKCKNLKRWQIRQGNCVTISFVAIQRHVDLHTPGILPPRA